jgi:hypothetical protein
MSIQLNQPYRIIPTRFKRYEAHYKIPAADVLVIPLKELGEEVLCDVRWEDSNGVMQVISNAMFVKENLIPLNAMLDVKLLEIWTHYYQSDAKPHEQ